ncbi:odorant receptor Or2 [Orussus abietinus]|uniref:odorant receptor Or2 n=1 Tax=Orussus abietinus TaxID=222816 RepID=UPI000C715C7D|nr:odorant receptor Or2 [Orussus abietinus]
MNGIISKSMQDKDVVSIVRDSEKRCILFASCYIMGVVGSACNYVVTPLIENMSENKTKVLPLRMWIKIVPYEETPYFEITYILQAFSVILTAATAFSFANFINTINLHTAGQFKIVQKRLQLTCTPRFDLKDRNPSQHAAEAHYKFKECVKQHKLLIWFMQEVENMCCYIILMQGIGSAVLICFSGFQLFLATETQLRKKLNVMLVSLSISELFMITWSSNDIIVQSLAIADAAYDADWHFLSYDKEGKALRIELVMLLVRAKRACYVTLGRFGPMSLETFKSVMTSAASYFTLLRSISDE